MLVFCDFSHEAISSAGNAVARIEQRSAMNPLLWLAGILGIILAVLIIVPIVPEYVKITATILLSLIVLLTFGVAIYFAIFFPDRLRSEEYQLKKDVMNYCEKMQSSPEKMIEALESNPSLTEK